MASTEQVPAAPVTKAPRGPSLTRRLRRGFDRWWFAYAMLLPVVITMGVLVFYPLARGIAFSFTNADRYTIGGQDIPSTYSYIGLENYKTLDDDPNFWNVFKFTGVWTFVNVFFHFTIGLGLALMLNRSLRFRGTYRMLLLVPWAVPVFITALGWRYLYNVPNGFFDQLLRAIGIDGPAWLGDPTWAKVSVIAVNVWLGIPFMMVALLGGLQAIDTELLDAAAVDGASPLRRFWDVTLPGLRPVAATVILLGIIWTFNLFAVIFLITQGGPADSTQILVTYSYRYFLDYQLYGVAAAYGVLILSFLLVFATFYRMLVRWTGEEKLVLMAVDTHAAGRGTRPRRRSGRGRGSSAGLHFTLIAATTIAIFPVLWIVLSSFKPNEVIKTQTDLQVVPDPWTLENYRAVLTQNDYEFLHWLANSVVVALFTTVIGVFLAATAAYAFSRYRFPGYRAGLMALLVAQMFPGVILLVPIYKIVVDLGLLDTKASLVLAYTTFALPFCVWMLKGYFDTIPFSLEEAGRIDGLTPFGTFWRIVMPLSLPGIAVTAFFMFITAWNEVLFANVFLTETENFTLPIGLRTYVFQFEQQYGWLTAGAVIVTIPAIIVFLFAQRYLVSGLTRGGVKG